MKAREAWRLASTAMAWLGGIAAIGGMGAALAADGPEKDKIEKGRELFLREWTPNDPRSHGGDGLGPVFNDSSCVSCHNAGGAGGAGPASKNVDILSAFANNVAQFVPPEPPGGGFAGAAAEALFGIDRPRAQVRSAPPKPRKPDTGPLVKAHAGFRTSRSVVLHRFGVEPEYNNWRTTMLGMDQFLGGMGGMMSISDEQKAQNRLNQVKMLNQFKANGNFTQGQAGEFSLLRSQRNPTALFGAGLMDEIPESVLIATAEAQRKADPNTAGRVAKQKDGRIGRFGWKAQTPSLNDFVLTACAVELGLEVPGHGQGGLPQKPEAKAKGLDMNAEECDELVAYVKSLAKPTELPAHSGDVAAGKELFAKVGCTSCHMQKLGDVDGIYSDLLVHDLGPDLGDTGQYGVFTPGSSDPEFQDDPTPPAGGTGPNGEIVVDQVQVQMMPRIAGPFGFFGRVAMQTIASPMALEEARIVTTTQSTGTATPAVPADAVPPLPLTDAPAEAAVAQAARPVEPAQAAPVNRQVTGPAGRQEWRTPPLWGFRDSGPYLHDGRADTLEQAVALHGGQGSSSAVKYFRLSAKERLQLESFLKSLAAPTDLQ